MRFPGEQHTEPGVVLADEGVDGSLELEIPMAVPGIVATRVTDENGPIHRGDLLVTSSTPGHAMKADLERVRIGMVLGEALENFDRVGSGLIDVLVSLK